MLNARECQTPTLARFTGQNCLELPAKWRSEETDIGLNHFSRAPKSYVGSMSLSTTSVNGTLKHFSCPLIEALARGLRCD